MTQDTAKDMGDDIFNLLCLIDNQLLMKGQKIESRKEVVYKEVMVNHQDILLVEVPVMSVIKTVTVKGTQHGTTVI
jgi:hypothetical protein